MSIEDSIRNTDTQFAEAFNRGDLAEERPWCCGFECLLSGKQTPKFEVSGSETDLFVYCFVS